MLQTLATVVAEVDGVVGADNIAAIGITNQRETVLAWNRSTGEPYGTAIVWQDRRTAQRCDELAAAGALPMVRERTGLVLDPYFSGTKIEWLLAERDIPVDDDLAIGTIDAWLIWNLTGGERVRHRCHQRQSHDVVRHPHAGNGTANCANCSTCRSTACPRSCRRAGASVSRRPSTACPPASRSAVSPATNRPRCSARRACEPGMAKNTYGTGSFVLLNVGATCPPPGRRDADHRGVDAGRRHDRTTRSRDRSSSPARRSSGCATVSDSSTMRPRPGRCGVRRRLRRRVRGAGLHRPRVAVVGPLRPRDDRRHHPRCRAGAPRARRRRVDGVPDTRRGRGDGGGEWHGDHGSPRRRRGLGDGSAVSDPGRPARGDRAPPGRPGDHGARRGIPRRTGRGRVADDRRRRRALGGGRRVRPGDRPDDSPTSCTASGCAPSSAPAPGPS